MAGDMNRRIAEARGWERFKPVNGRRDYAIKPGTGRYYESPDYEHDANLSVELLEEMEIRDMSPPPKPTNKHVWRITVYLHRDSDQAGPFLAIRTAPTFQLAVAAAWLAWKEQQETTDD